MDDSLRLRIAEKIVSRNGGDLDTVMENLHKPKAVLMVSSDCNAKCTHCYLPYRGNRSPEDTLETVERLQDQDWNIIIAGSENLLNPDYLKSYEKAGQTHILSNGIILQQEKSLYDKLRVHGIDLIKLSLHFGMDKELRSVPEHVVAEVIKEAKERDFSVQVTTTLTSQNYQDIKEMCEKAMGYGVDRIHFGRFIPMGRGKNDTLLTLDQNQANEFFQRMVEVRSQYDNMKIRAQGYFGPRPGSLGEELAEMNCYCPAGIMTVAIDPDNNVYGCPFTMGKEHIIGRLEDEVKIDRCILPEKRDTCIAHLIHSS